MWSVVKAATSGTGGEQDLLLLPRLGCANTLRTLHSCPVFSTHVAKTTDQYRNTRLLSITLARTPANAL